jgi:hypothetical protein
MACEHIARPGQSQHAHLFCVSNLQVGPQYRQFCHGRGLLEHRQNDRGGRTAGQGEARAEYGAFLIRNLAARLTAKLGEGFSEQSLRNMGQFLFKDILAGGRGSPPDFDVNRFNLTQARKYDGLALDELIKRFRAVRQETIRIVREMKEEDLNREGMHAFNSKGKLGRFIRWAYEHARIHEEDIRKVLKR